MQNQFHKKRDMIRSVLPSKARKMARFMKSHSNRKARHRANQAIREWEEESDLVMELHQADQNLKRDVRLAVSERRAADKLSPFLRWAKNQTQEFEKEDYHSKYYKVKSLLNGAKDVISYHALGHFSSKADFNPYFARSILDYYGVRNWKKGRPDYQEFLKLLAEAFVLDHKGLNKFLKTRGETYHHCQMGEDPCVEVRTATKKVFRWKLRSQSWRIFTGPMAPLPSSDLLWCFSLTEKKEIEHHNWLACKNRVLIFGVQDLEKVAEFWYWRVFSPYGGNSQLLDFFRDKGLLS